MCGAPLYLARRNRVAPRPVLSIEMSKEGDPAIEQAVRTKLAGESVPRPTVAFRRRAWLKFQRALDPFAPPKPLRIGRR
jgi:hypothetical protein